jgi:hypothetical protein
MQQEGEFLETPSVYVPLPTEDPRKEAGRAEWVEGPEKKLVHSSGLLRLLLHSFLVSEIILITNSYSLLPLAVRSGT